MIRTVVFDIDDTLYNYTNANQKAVAALVDYMRNGFGWDHDEFMTRQKAAMEKIHQLVGSSGAYRNRLLRYQVMFESADLPICPNAQKLCEIYWKTMLENSVPEDGAEDFLSYLHNHHIRTGIGSDATVHQQFAKLEKLGLLRYFDFIVTSEEAGVEKPDPKFFARCSEKILCLPEEVLFIGDNPKKDYLGAESAGYHALWYNPADKQSDFPMKQLHHYQDAPAILEALNQETM